MENPLGSLRVQIDSIDEKLVTLFVQRMALADDVATAKLKNNIAITDAGREQQVIDQALAGADPRDNGSITLLMRTVMALSRDRQRNRLHTKPIELLPAPRPHNPKAACAYAGAPGAWGEVAAQKLMPQGQLSDHEYFEDVFAAVKKGVTDYGVLPIENSQTGAIGEVYDLLKTHGLYIVGQVQVPIRHCLMAKPGATLADIREVFSHPQGFLQCHNYLKKHRFFQTTCSNTATAALHVHEAPGHAFAAIGSARAAEINGLVVLDDQIVDSTANRTRFVLVAPQPEYDAHSSVISVTFSTAHRSGALCEALLPFLCSGINLSRIESRPESQDQYRFFADLQGNFQDADVMSALRQAAASCAYFEVLGCFGTTA